MLLLLPFLLHLYLYHLLELFICFRDDSSSHKRAAIFVLHGLFFDLELDERRHFLLKSVLDAWADFDQKRALVLVIHDFVRKLLFRNVLVRFVHLAELSGLVQPLGVKGR